MAKDRGAAFRFLTVAGCFVVCYAGPAQAGLFDQLFGRPDPAQSVYNRPVYSYAPQHELGSPLFPDEVPVPHRKAVRHEPDYEHPILQKTTDLMHDHTLRRGDAVMMADGIHIYEGHESGSHTADDFVPLREAPAVKHQMAALAELDAARRFIAPVPVRAPVLRMAAQAKRSLPHRASPIVVGMLERDGNEKAVRYVGP